MAFKKGLHKRRTDRLMFRVPLRAEGLTEAGEPFECQGHAVSVNRYGAHIRLGQLVRVTRELYLTNLNNGLRGEFRVVRVLESPSGSQTDIGVESLGNYPTFWGIEFPTQPAKPGETRGLLECQRCRAATLHTLLLDEIELLESGGTVRKHCTACRSKTEWKFAISGSQASLPEPASSAGEELPAEHEGRKGRRLVVMHRPVTIRTAAGQVEILQTENLSKDEIRCASEKNYEVNQLVTLEWENTGTGQRLRVQGRVRRRQSIAGSQRVVYSIRHEGTPAILPPAPLKPSRHLYVAMGTLLAAACVLLAFSVEGIIASLEFPSNTAGQRVAGLAVVLLLVVLAYKAWKTILTREPESRRLFKKRHLIAASLTGVAFLGSLGAGAIDGMQRNAQRQQTLVVLRDFATARLFEKNIDAAENRVTNSPEDYADVCSTLHMLARQWKVQLEALEAGAQKLQRAGLWHSARFGEAVNDLRKMLALDRHKLRLVREQAALKSEAETLDPDKQLAFWQSHFPPLRQQILNLDAQKNHLVKSLLAGKSLRPSQDGGIHSTPVGVKVGQ